MKKIILSGIITTLTFSSIATATERENTSPVVLSETNLLLEKSNNNSFFIAPYGQNYIMETYSNGNFYNQKGKKPKHDEVKFQISLAFPIWRDILGKNTLLAASYTQQSWFQLSNTVDSSPFRETNYEPQLFLSWGMQYPLWRNWKINDLEFGINHQSNGRSDQFKLSRSWNRLYTKISATQGNWLVEFKPWWRIPEKQSSDDNPDIEKYRGHFDLGFGYKYHQHQVKLTGHYNFKSGKGGLLADYSYPITNQLRLYIQYFGGYGESLVDYQQRIQRIGVGIALNDLF